MSPAAQLPLTIIADDLTGPCGTGALFAARGPVPVTVWPDAALRAPVSVVDTETRALDPADAARRVSAVARSVARTRIFKKIDSTLRGPIGAELDALLRATSAAGALVCPRSEEHTSELQSLAYLVCRLLLEKKKKMCDRQDAEHVSCVKCL